MEAPWSEVSLAIIAEYSKPVSIAVILVCFISMAVFIIRLNLYGKVDVKPGEAIPGQVMRGVYNPYSLGLSNTPNSSLKGGVWLDIKCQAPCFLQCFWGVSIADLYPGIYLPWQEFATGVIEDTWMEQDTTHRGEKIRFDHCANRRIKLEIPKEVKLDLGELPRKKYPLVVVLLNDGTIQEAQNTCVVGHVSVFHLQDDECSGKSHIISQFIRTPYGMPYHLQQLYVAEEEPPSQQTDIQQQTSSGDDGEAETSSSKCVVCQTEPVNRVLLPCRHACVCDSCFMYLSKCPMCRSPIVSYFQLSPTDDATWLDADYDGSPPPWWERWNDRINAYFGFT